MTSNINLFWFRQDLRLSDNPGLLEAAKNSFVMPIYILEEDKIGSASKWWLHHSLKKLDISLKGKLHVYVGSAEGILLKIIQENNIKGVYWNRCYEPWRIKHDTALKKTLTSLNIECKSFNASLLLEPWENLKSDQTPYKVFTPFYKKGYLQSSEPRKPLPAPSGLELFKDPSYTNKIEDLSLLPSIQWCADFHNHWEIGEKAAQDKLLNFVDNQLLGYEENRNYPAKLSCSRLSPHLHFGEVSPYQVWHVRQTRGEAISKDSAHFLRELCWREFSYYLLYHFPEITHKNFQSKFDHFPWLRNEKLLKAWQRGQTGYPIVDAGMRELWQTGYMHNRVRMIVGSFLVKNLLLNWQLGAEWFWDCLLDADLANNSASWQWVAGSGADAAPYFRIFNPVTQGEKFDPQGEYTKYFVPELKRLENKYLFKPWEAPNSMLQAAGIVLGKDYPKPIVDLKSSRDQALQAYKSLF